MVYCFGFGGRIGSRLSIPTRLGWQFCVNAVETFSFSYSVNCRMLGGITCKYSDLIISVI
jgi:hypothetical protein